MSCVTDCVACIEDVAKELEGPEGAKHGAPVGNGSGFPGYDYDDTGDYEDPQAPHDDPDTPFKKKKSQRKGLFGLPLHNVSVIGGVSPARLSE